MYKVKIEKFSGPLDLLLQLIFEKKMDITEISIAEVTDQYVEHIESMDEKDSKLKYLNKSNMITSG